MWNKKVQNIVGYQIIRASDSIAANIAEGMGGILRRTGKGFIYIQEALWKKLNHGYENLFGGRF